MHKITVKDVPHLDFGDVRRNERFVTIINNVSSQPGASIPKQNKSWYDTKATYEFFKNKDVSIEALGKSSKRKQRSFEDKESYRWYEGMSEVNKLLGDKIHKIHIADREADVYELFFHAFESNTDLLIRARHNRSLSNGSHLWDSIAEQPVAATVDLDIRDKTGKKKLKVGAEVRYHPVEILRPQNNKNSYESVALTAIDIKEKSSEQDIIHWKLLTTLEVNNTTDVLQCVKWYTYRWLIERFHYVLKSGTKIEELQLKDAESLQKAIAVYSMAAFRVMQLVYESRHHPEVSCTVVLTKAQWQTLYMLIHNSNQIPKKPPSLQQALMWIGKLGGHLGRKSDGPPGLKTVWQGYQQLCHAANVYELMTQKI